MKSVIITALFDIDREKKGDGRSVNDYLTWFKVTLKLRVPMVIYTEEKFHDFILKNRDMSITKVIIQTIDAVPYYKYKHRIEEILNMTSYQHRMMCPERVECRLPMYNVIQYSKFGWLEDAIDNKYFTGDYFFWMDAGCSRFFDDFDLSQSFPKDDFIIPEDKLYIQGNYNTERLKHMPDNEYKWNANCMLVGGLFGGSPTTIKKISCLIEKLFVEEMLDDNTVNNEQIALAMLWKRYPDLFKLYFEFNGKPLPIFLKLCRG